MAKSKSKFETILREVTGVKPESGQDRQTFLIALGEAASKLEEDDWDDLPKAVQDWVNDCGDAFNAKDPVPELPDIAQKATAEEEEEGDTDKNWDTQSDDEDLNEEETDVAEDEDVEEKAPAKKKKKVVVAKKAKTAKPAKATKVKAAKPAKDPKINAGFSDSGVKVKIKRAIIKNPTISVDDLVEQLSKNGMKMSETTVKGIRAEFRHSLRLLKHDGLLDIAI